MLMLVHRIMLPVLDPVLLGGREVSRLQTHVRKHTLNTKTEREGGGREGEGGWRKGEERGREGKGE